MMRKFDGNIVIALKDGFNIAITYTTMLVLLKTILFDEVFIMHGFNQFGDRVAVWSGIARVILPCIF